MPRRKKRRKPYENPETYKCQNPECVRGAPLEVRRYRESLSDDVAPDLVHRVVEPDMPGFTIICVTCGHFTVVTRHERPPPTS